MPVQIQFLDTTQTSPKETQRFQLREENGTWIGPEVHLLPVQQLPLISGVDMKVTGRPEVVAARLQSGYTSRRFPKEISLVGPRSLGSGRIRNANPLPSEAVCELQVTVTYFDATSDGQPVGDEKSQTAVCLLYTGASPQPPRTDGAQP